MGIVLANLTNVKTIIANNVDVLYFNDSKGNRLWSKERTLTIVKGSYIDSVSGDGTYIQGSQVTISCLVSSVRDESHAYQFDGWYVNNVKVSSNITYTFILDDNMIIEARGKQYTRSWSQYYASTSISIEHGGDNYFSVTSYLDTTLDFYANINPYQGVGETAQTTIGYTDKNGVDHTLVRPTMRNGQPVSYHYYCPNCYRVWFKGGWVKEGNMAGPIQLTLKGSN